MRRRRPSSGTTRHLGVFCQETTHVRLNIPRAVGAKRSPGIGQCSEQYGGTCLVHTDPRRAHRVEYLMAYTNMKREQFRRRGAWVTQGKPLHFRF